jgi:hypothetical protein
MQKNISGQKWIVFAFNLTDNSPFEGDADNITANLRLDGGTANPIDDTNPTELEAGYYYFNITQAETNADSIVICPSSVTSDVQVIGVPGVVWTLPAKYPATLASADVSDYVPANLTRILSTAITETSTGYLATAFKKLFDIETPVFTEASINQTGDAYSKVTDGTIGLANLKTLIDLIKAKTDTLGGGSGLITWEYLLTEPPEGTGIPIVGAEVWVTSDAAGATVLATGTTNVSGIATFALSAGTVYVWRKKDGYSFINPDQETVS